MFAQPTGVLVTAHHQVRVIRFSIPALRFIRRG
jgi:hypothetical protein